MPQVFKVGPYWIFFWSNEGSPVEPVHFHIAEGGPTANALSRHGGITGLRATAAQARRGRLARRRRYAGVRSEASSQSFWRSSLVMSLMTLLMTGR